MGSIDLVALATVADVVPLVGLNRAFVRQGLAIMRGRAPSWARGAARRRGPRRGAGMLASRLSRRPAHQCRRAHRRCGPGRAPAADRGSDRGGQACGRARRLNRERQAIEVEAVAEAEAQALLRPRIERPTCRSSSTSSAEWHPGVVGLIAARTKERFRRPAFAFTLNADGTATGSGRSVVGVDLGCAVRAAVEAGIAIKGGGHAMAAGVTIVGRRNCRLSGIHRSRSSPSGSA